MSAFVSKRSITKVILSPDDYPVLDREEWVEISTGVTVKMVMDIGDSDAPIAGVLFRAIKGWSFLNDDDTDEVAGISEENIADLDLGIAWAIWEIIQEFLPLALRVQFQQIAVEEKIE